MEEQSPKPEGDEEELDYPDNLFLRAAGGWYMIGNYSEAAKELSKISDKNARDPKVLRLKGNVYWMLRDIDRALEASDLLIAQAPQGQTFEYIFKANLLSYQGKHRDAYNLLLNSAHLFQNHATYLYDLARYAAHCNLRNEALHWIRMALLASPSLKDIALESKALESIREEIERMNLLESLS